MTMVGEKGRVRDLQREATARKILATSLELFEQIGFDKTTVDRIVEQAGVAKGTFFHHFASKGAVLSWVGEQQIRRLEAAITRNRGFEKLDFPEQIRFVLLTMGEAHARRKKIIQLLAVALFKGDLLTGPHSKPVASLDALLRPLVLTAQQNGQARRDVAAEVIVAYIRGTYFQSVLFWLAGERKSYRDVAGPFLDLLFDGVRANKDHAGG
jgi:AcrR family transcriptional regulator